MCELLASCSKSKSAISSGTCVGMDTTHQAAASVSFFLLPLPLLVSCCSCHPLEQRAPEEDERALTNREPGGVLVLTQRSQAVG